MHCSLWQSWYCFGKSCWSLWLDEIAPNFVISYGPSILGHSFWTGLTPSLLLGAIRWEVCQLIWCCKISKRLTINLCTRWNLDRWQTTWRKLRSATWLFIKRSSGNIALSSDQSLWSHVCKLENAEEGRLINSSVHTGWTLRTSREFRWTSLDAVRNTPDEQAICSFNISSGRHWPVLYIRVFDRASINGMALNVLQYLCNTIKQRRCGSLAVLKIVRSACISQQSQV